MLEYSERTTVTNGELAILGLVAEGPRHGYQVEQDIEARGMREWTEIGFSSIYYLLNKLEAAGWLESRLAEEAQPGKRGPARKVYTLTESGWGVYRAAVRERLAHPRPRSADFALGLANLPVLPPGEVRAALEEQRAALAERIRHVQAKNDQDRQAARGHLPPHVETLFAYSEALMAAELNWLTRYLEDNRLGEPE
jgi:DNA-binding PadR family transcriptional regulator